MSDVMQFVRELLEGKPYETGVRGTVTHAVRLQTNDPNDPTTYLFQIEALGFLYADIAFTRDPKLQDLQPGTEVIAHRPLPESEGYPFFLLLSSMPEPEPVQKEEEVAEPTEVGTSDPVAVYDPELPPFDSTKKDEEREEQLVAA